MPRFKRLLKKQNSDKSASTSQGTESTPCMPTHPTTSILATTHLAPSFQPTSQAAPTFQPASQPSQSVHLTSHPALMDHPAPMDQAASQPSRSVHSTPTDQDSSQRGPTVQDSSQRGPTVQASSRKRSGSHWTVEAIGIYDNERRDYTRTVCGVLCFSFDGFSCNAK
ncbi:PREDICTED: uncharacterized protein LOC109244846 isoform X1 [Nicotiana attenuata]|uniref:uncharacterized protein LOC109244846 isoform X1 n=1 Tax=Nicotiana attenuata TaxID=49451 RepID=UPI000904C7F4|nr:PREDICTED: uncharacterized protein LOC109244846 isoform X1 [Nicotiana attenuata]XP_019267548.1 PREDICTED: uncharacterized protein LOC109244846 isoform X1 [Nicotiana attenuata]XP_019267549.1 PREDICTED: uncharacterized protein LOC109244846 isoform X1 [Nicotiana attenuata]